MALYMVVERFEPGEMREVYARVRGSGRSLPEGLTYVQSWVEANLLRCFQLMECDNPALLPGMGRFVGRARRFRDRAGDALRGGVGRRLPRPGCRTRRVTGARRLAQIVMFEMHGPRDPIETLTIFDATRLLLGDSIRVHESP
jgi:hypothetical protein